MKYHNASENPQLEPSIVVLKLPQWRPSFRQFVLAVDPKSFLPTVASEK